MTTSVIIPTLDPGTAMIRRCLDALTGIDAEVIVQHDVDRDGFAETCNRGAARADADVLVFLNDDTVPLDGWLEALVRPLDGRLSDVIAGGLLLYTDGSVQHSGVFLRRGHSGELEAFNRRMPAPSGPVPAVTGACLAVGRGRFDELGGFDTDYRNGYEDVDLCLKGRQAGMSVEYVADCRVIHLESQSPGRFDHVAHNVSLLQQRWGHLSV